MPNQTPQPPKYLDSIKSILQTGAVRQLVFMIGVALSVAVGIVLYMQIKEPIYRPLDYPVTTQNMALVIDTLDKSGIQYKLNEREGVVYIPAEDVQRAKLKLAASGIPRDDGFSYSFLSDQNNMANSQFIENARYMRALENDLSKTIMSIEGVSSAKVHLAVPQNKIFADESGKTTASVVLNVSPGFSTDKEKIRAIMQIIAGSVPGLDPKDVAITDQYGHYLVSGDQESLFSAEQLNYQNNIQTFYEKRIQSMISQMLGENKASVRVYADIDFSQEEEAQEQYDPEKKAIRSEQASSETTDGAGASGVPGSLSNTPPAGEADKSGASGSGGGGSSHSQSTKNYELTKVVNYKKSNAAKIKSLSVALVVDNETIMDPKTKQLVTKPLDPDKINKITSLVKTTIGYDAKRGDQVTIVNSSFKAPEVVAVAPTHLWDQVWFWDMVKKVVGIIFGFVFLIFLYQRLGNLTKAQAQPKPTQSNQLNSDEDAPLSAEVQETKQERMSRLKLLAATEPTRVALIIKNWVGK